MTSTPAGFLGTVIGSVTTLGGQILIPCLRERERRHRVEPRRQLLRNLLNDPRFNWRELKTLTNVIGADDETTKTLLIEVGARGSEDGQHLWGLLTRNPLLKQ